MLARIKAINLYLYQARKNRKAGRSRLRGLQNMMFCCITWKRLSLPSAP